MEGNVFEDPEQARWFPDGTGTVSRFGSRAVAPAEFAAGDLAELRGGETLVIERDGSFRYTSPEEIDGAGPRVYFEEWFDPVITGIRWVSEIIEIAGGTDIFAELRDRRSARERVVASEEVVPGIVVPGPRARNGIDGILLDDRRLVHRRRGGFRERALAPQVPDRFREMIDGQDADSSDERRLRRVGARQQDGPLSRLQRGHGARERAANAAVHYSMQNAGQSCTSTERVYVEEAVYESFLNRVVEKVRALRQGPSDQEVDLGGMISEEQLNKVSAQIDEAIRNGAKALTGARVNPDLPGLYYLPTVLIDLKHDMAVIQDETFGPVIPIVKVRNASEALQLANDSRYGLNASVFARDKKLAWEMAEKLQAGTVCVNDVLINYGIPDVPMGGIKDSGHGRRHGAAGIRKYCYQKTIVIDRLGLKNDLLWFPLTHKKTQAARRFISLLWRSGWRNKFRLPPRNKG